MKTLTLALIALASTSLAQTNNDKIQGCWESVKKRHNTIVCIENSEVIIFDKGVEFLEVEDALFNTVFFTHKGKDSWLHYSNDKLEYSQKGSKKIVEFKRVQK